MSEQGINLPRVLEQFAQLHGGTTILPAELGSAPETAAAIVRPSGQQVVDLLPLAQARAKWAEELAAHPRVRSGFAELVTAASFVAHVNRFKVPGASVIYSGKDVLLALYDYHGPTEGGSPGHCRHGAAHCWPYSDEWKAWSSLGDLSQAALAEWLEEHIADLVDPAAHAGSGALDLARLVGMELAGPSRMLALGRGLEVNASRRVVNAQVLATGETSLTYEETHETKEKGVTSQVPGGFLIAIPVFDGGPRYVLSVRLRYSLRGGSIFWKVRIARAADAEKEAREETLERIRKETGVPVFEGMHEGSGSMNIAKYLDR